MDIYKAYKVEESKATSGVWYRARGCSAEFLLAHSGRENRAYFSFLTESARKLPHDLTPEKDLELNVRCFAKYIVKDWKNVCKGAEQVPYSYDNCVKLLSALPKLFEEIRFFSDNYRNFTERDLPSVEEEVEQTAKKSQTT